LTAVPQQINRFRDNSQDDTLYLLWQDDDAKFHEKTERGDFVPFEDRANIKPAPPLSAEEQARLWLTRDYGTALLELLHNTDEEGEDEALMLKKSKRYGEITFPEEKRGWSYSDQFGLFPKI